MLCAHQEASLLRFWASLSVNHCRATLSFNSGKYRFLPQTHWCLLNHLVFILFVNSRNPDTAPDSGWALIQSWSLGIKYQGLLLHYRWAKRPRAYSLVLWRDLHGSWKGTAWVSNLTLALSIFILWANCSVSEHQFSVKWVNGLKTPIKIAGLCFICITWKNIYKVPDTLHATRKLDI